MVLPCRSRYGGVIRSSFPREPSFSDERLAPGVAWLWCALSLLFAFFWGRSFFKVVLKLITVRIRKKTWDQLKRWGMEDEAFGVQPWLTLFLCSALGAVALWVTIAVAIPSLTDQNVTYFSVGFETEHPGLGPSIPYLVLVIAMGFQWGWWDYSTTTRRMGMFESLPPVFRARFPVTEILSMYECLRAAPDIFWENYISLPAVQVNETTNRKFRERAAPYQIHQGEVTQRALLLVGVAAVLIAVPTLLYVLLEGRLLGSISDWFVSAGTEPLVPRSNASGPIVVPK